MPAPKTQIRVRPYSPRTAVIVDALILILPGVLAASLVTKAGSTLESLLPSIGLPIGACSFVLLNATFGIYSLEESSKHWLERSSILLVSLAITLGNCVSFLCPKIFEALGASNTKWAALCLYLFTLYNHWSLQSGFATHGARSILILGEGSEGPIVNAYLESIGSQEAILGYVANRVWDSSTPITRLGRIDDLAEIVERERAEQIIYTETTLSEPQTKSILGAIRLSGVQVTGLLDFIEKSEQFCPPQALTSQWWHHASSQPKHYYLQHLKRQTDILVSCTALILCSPIMLAWTVRCYFRSTHRTRQSLQRIGYRGQSFSIFQPTIFKSASKARRETDQDDPESATGLSGPTPWERRVGSLVNVLLGHMSLIGPRPDSPEAFRLHSAAVEHYQDRLLVRPGIIGWAQLKELGSDRPLTPQERAGFDFYYLKHMSLLVDIGILFETLFRLQTRLLKCQLVPSKDSHPIPERSIKQTPRIFSNRSTI